MIAKKDVSAFNLNPRVCLSLHHYSEVRGRLEQRRTAAESERSRGAIVGALLEAKRAGKVKGVLGRLGDLGKAVQADIRLTLG